MSRFVGTADLELRTRLSPDSQARHDAFRSSSPERQESADHLGQYSHEAWEARKDELCRLYKDKKMTLVMIMDYMGKKGFHATARMYKYRFARWGLTKNRRDGRFSKKTNTLIQHKPVKRPPLRPAYVKSPDKLLVGELFFHSFEELLTRRQHTMQPDLMRAADGLIKGFVMFAQGHVRLGGVFTEQAFGSLHLLTRKPSLHDLCPFLAIQIWSPNRGVFTEMWKYLSAYPSENPSQKNFIQQLYDLFNEYIQNYGFRAYLDLITYCFGQIIFPNHGSIDEDAVKAWSHDMEIHPEGFGNRADIRVTYVAKRCVAALMNAGEVGSRERLHYYMHEKKRTAQAVGQELTENLQKRSLSPNLSLAIGTMALFQKKHVILAEPPREDDFETHL